MGTKEKLDADFSRLIYLHARETKVRQGGAREIRYLVVISRTNQKLRERKREKGREKEVFGEYSE